MKERGVLFLFFGGKDLSVVLPKESTQTMNHHVLCKGGGGEAFNSLSRLFTSSNDDNDLNYAYYYYYYC